MFTFDAFGEEGSDMEEAAESAPVLPGGGGERTVLGERPPHEEIPVANQSTSPRKQSHDIEQIPKKTLIPIGVGI